MVKSKLQSRKHLHFKLAVLQSRPMFHDMKGQNFLGFQAPGLLMFHVILDNEACSKYIQALVGTQFDSLGYLFK